jgi:DNA-directed RNA polymerase subunit RPC12/RpoP
MPVKECNYEPCHKKATAKGYCGSHYRQLQKGQELRPLRQYKRYPVPGPGKKICTVCERVKVVEDFYMKANGKTRYAECKECSIKRILRNVARRKAAVSSDN